MDGVGAFQQAICPEVGFLVSKSLIGSSVHECFVLLWHKVDRLYGVSRTPAMCCSSAVCWQECLPFAPRSLPEAFCSLSGYPTRPSAAVSCYFPGPDLGGMSGSIYEWGVAQVHCFGLRRHPGGIQFANAFAGQTGDRKTLQSVECRAKAPVDRGTIVGQFSFADYGLGK